MPSINSRRVNARRLFNFIKLNQSSLLPKSWSYYSHHLSDVKNIFTAFIIATSKRIETLTGKDEVELKGLEDLTFKERASIIEYLVDNTHVSKKLSVQLLKIAAEDEEQPARYTTFENLAKCVASMNYEEEIDDVSGSGLVAVLLHNALSSIKFFFQGWKGDKVQTRKSKQGARFKFFHNLSNKQARESLFELQIAHIDTEHNFTEHCVITALRSQIDDGKLKLLNSKVKGVGGIPQNVKRERLSIFLKAENITVKLHYLEILNTSEKEQHREIIIGAAKHTIDAEICLLDDHYFRYITDTKVTSYYIKNHLKIDPLDHQDANYIQKFCGKYYKCNVAATIDSFNLVKHLLREKENCLVPITKKPKVQESKEYEGIPSIEDNIGIGGDDLIIDEEFENLIINDESDMDAEEKLDTILEELDTNRDRLPFIQAAANDDELCVDTIYFDFETCFTKDKKHLPFGVCWKGDDQIMHSLFGILGEPLIKQFLGQIANGVSDKINKKWTELSKRPKVKGVKKPTPYIKMYAHNSTYDGSFLVPYIDRLTTCEHLGRNVFLNGVILTTWGSKVNINIKDSYRLIPKPLAAFPSLFGFQGEKEAMYYDLYQAETMDTIKNTTKATIDKVIAEFESKVVTSNIATCEELLKKKIFWSNLQKYQNEDGTYDLLAYNQYYCERDVDILQKGMSKYIELMYEVTGLNVHKFYSLPSIASNYFKKEGCFKGVYYITGDLKEWFQPFIHGGRCMIAHNKKCSVNKSIELLDANSLYPSAMRRMTGFLKGKPKLVLAGATVESLNAYDGYYVRCLCTKLQKKRAFPLMSYQKDGSKNWSNDLDGQILYLDKVAIEDAIKFCGAEFQILDGVYFDEGFNTKINEVIVNITNARLEAKKNGNKPLAEMYKLISNSSYGKQIQKSTTVKVKYVKKESTENFFNNNYDKIIQWIECPKTYNKFYIEDYEGENIGYPHTGAAILSWSKRIMNEVMCLAEDIGVEIFYQDTDSTALLASDVKRLVEAFKATYGRDLEGLELQQFKSDLKIEDDYGNSLSNPKNLKCIRGLFLGKKMYCLELESDDGKHYYMRMKGVPKKSLIHAINQEFKGEMDMYQHIYDGETVIFDLGVNNRARFEKIADVYYSGKPIIREICIERDKVRTIVDEMEIDLDEEEDREIDLDEEEDKEIDFDEEEDKEIEFDD